MGTLFPEDTAAALIPESPTLESLRVAAAGCTACRLHELGTQTVFGEGAKSADLMLVGEQPGDVEDRQGRPFVGPAGKLLDRALDEAGIDRTVVYVTNVVKHFKWMPKGKRRIHQKPKAEEIRACKPWLEAELDVVNPRVVVCLGATAAKALLGPKFRVTEQHGTFVDWDHPALITATLHPSAILRAEESQREAQMSSLIADLEIVAKALRKSDVSS